MPTSYASLLPAQSRRRQLIRSLKGEGPLSPVAPSASFSPSRYAPCSLVRKKRPCEPQWFIEKHQSLVRMSVLQQTVSLAAQLRAFSSLLSLPSQAQSVIKALRRQGIGFADVFNTARFLLSRIESLSALLQVFQIFRGRAGRDCVFHFVPATDSPDTRISVVAFVVLSDCCTRGGKTLFSRMIVSVSATCRGLRPCPLWHLWPVSASAYADAKTVPKHHRSKKILTPECGCCHHTASHARKVISAA